MRPEVVDLVVSAALDDPATALDAWTRCNELMDLPSCWDPDVLGLLGAVHANLQRAASNAATTVDHAELLHGVHRRNWYLTQRTEAAVTALTNMLTGRGIDHAVLGGVALCRLAGIEPGERRVDDTTFVVHPDRVDEAVSLAAAQRWDVPPRPRRRADRFRRPALCGLPLDPDRPAAGRVVVRFAVRPHVLAPIEAVSAIEPAAIGAGPTEPAGTGSDDASIPLLVTLLGGPTDPPGAGRQWEFDVARLLPRVTVDPGRVGTLTERWGAGPLAAARLDDVVQRLGQDRVAGLRAALGYEDRQASSATSVLVGRPDAPTWRRLTAEWRAVTRLDPPWRAPRSIASFVAARADADGPVSLAGGLVRSIRAHR